MILYYKSFNIPERLCLFPTLSLHPGPNSFSIYSLVFSKSLLTPTALFLAFSSLPILFHGVKPDLDTIPGERQRANRKELRISYGWHARLPLTLKSGLFPIFSPSCMTVLIHIQLVISQHHMLSHSTVTYSDIPHLHTYTCFPFLTAGLLTYICWIPILLILTISAFYQDHFGL